MNYILKNFQAINENETFDGLILIRDGKIEKIYKGNEFRDVPLPSSYHTIDLKGQYLLPGVIDDQVHFRDPGMTYKGDLYTESKAAVAGGITSFMDMPNTIPNAITRDILEEKYALAAEKSLANYSFYIGGSNTNIEEILKTDPARVCGIKLFLGSSTGNMLIDDPDILARIFSEAPLLIAAHCEDDGIIQKNAILSKERFGTDVPVSEHPKIRSEEACFVCTEKYVGLAEKHGARFHVIHISTEKELSLFRNDIPLEEKKITNEVCVHHLWFSEEDYKEKGKLIKWNPAIKRRQDRDALRKALIDDLIDVVATDHAPHTIEEKSRPYFQAPSGAPLVQHALVAMMELYHSGEISMEKVVRKMSHDPARLFRIDKRGYIREGYWADLTVVGLSSWRVSKENILYKCGWSPFEGQQFHYRVNKTFVNGTLVYDEGQWNEQDHGMRLTFNR